jgi:hypothetical protein
MALLSLAAGTATMMLWPHAQAQAPKQPAPKQQSQPQAQAPKPAQIDRNGVSISVTAGIVWVTCRICSNVGTRASRRALAILVSLADTLK